MFPLFQAFFRSQEPADRSKYRTSYYNTIKYYNNTLARTELSPSDIYEEIEVKEHEEKYPGLRITYKYSTIFLAPMAHCDPIEYIYDDNLVQKTIDAHKWINSHEPDLGCESKSQKFDKGVRLV